MTTAPTVEQQKPASEPEVLDLSALTPERPKARIRTSKDPDGTLYEVRVPEDYSAGALSRYMKRIEEFDRLWDKGALDRSEEKHIERVLNGLAGELLIGAPARDVAALPAASKRGLVMRFFASVALTTMGATGLRPEMAESGSTSET